MDAPGDSPESKQKKFEQIFEKIHHAGLAGGRLDFGELERKGVLTKEEGAFVLAELKAEAFSEKPSDDPSERIGQLLCKVTQYQRSLRKDRAVDLEELIRERVFDPADIEFMRSNAVTYKPHRLADYHSLDMFEMPTEDGGCVFMGPASPALKKRTHLCGEIQAVIEDFLGLPNPDLLMHLDFSPMDGAGISPGFISFGFETPEWREKITMVRRIAAEFGIPPLQDEEIQGRWTLSFNVPKNPMLEATLAFALITRGCGFSDIDVVTYSAGALDILDAPLE